MVKMAQGPAFKNPKDKFLEVLTLFPNFWSNSDLNKQPYTNMMHRLQIIPAEE